MARIVSSTQVGLVSLLMVVAVAAAHRNDAGAATCDVVVRATQGSAARVGTQSSSVPLVPSLAEAQLAARRTVASKRNCGSHVPGAAGALGAACRVTVCLEPGTHEPPATGLVMDARDSAVSYTAMDSRTGATVVSGGTPVVGWMAAGDGSGLWRAALASSLAPARNLWVNGVRYNRTRVPGASLSLTANADGYTTPDPPAWSQPSAVEMVWPSQIKNWIAPRCTVASVTTTGSTTQVSVLPGCWKALTARNGGPAPPPMNVENVGKPTQPGQFFADFASGDLWLYPLPGVNMSASSTSVVVGTKASVVSGAGVKSHAWSGVTFAYSTWGGVGVGDGYVPTQTAVHACPSATGGTTSCEPVGAVHFTASESLRFVNCSFVHQVGCARARVLVRSR